MEQLLINIPEYPRYRLAVQGNEIKVISFCLTPGGKYLTLIQNGDKEGYKLWERGVSKFFSLETLRAIHERFKLKLHSDHLKRKIEDMNFTTRTSIDGVVQTGHWIIGSLNKTTNAFSASATPAIHLTELSAKKEAGRLAGIDKTKKYVVLKVAAIANVQEVSWE